MNSLYSKIFLWLLISLVISMAGFFATSFYIGSQLPRPGDYFSEVNARFLAQAREAYVSGGKLALQTWLAELSRNIGGRHHLALAGDRRDLDTGEDLDPLVRQFREGPRGRPLFRFLPPSGQRVIVQHSTDRKYIWVVETPRLGSNPNAWLPLYLWILIPVGLFSWLLASHMAAPLRHLQTAVDRFGRGDLSSRVGWNRSDELGRLGAAFDDMAARIETLLTAERRLLQDVSHELRSPLARLGFALELARKNPSESANFDRIRREIDRLSHLVQTLIEVTRAEGDPEARQSQPTDLAALVRNAVEDAGIEAQTHGCRLELQRLDASAISGDPELLRRAVDNVLRNAVHHSPAGTAVEVRLNARNGHTFIEVRDFGPGVPADLLERIFHPFVRAEQDRARDSGGVGLGLSIARRAIELHHGRVTAANAHPGLVVTIEL